LRGGLGDRWSHTLPSNSPPNPLEGSLDEISIEFAGIDVSRALPAICGFMVGRAHPRSAGGAFQKILPGAENGFHQVFITWMKIPLNPPFSKGDFPRDYAKFPPLTKGG